MLSGARVGVSEKGGRRPSRYFVTGRHIGARWGASCTDSRAVCGVGEAVLCFSLRHPVEILFYELCGVTGKGTIALEVLCGASPRVFFFVTSFLRDFLFVSFLCRHHCSLFSWSGW
ncbi:hypothetical protein TcCL_NonESM04957 [Trypanosoma cruzi]|nr:hypothetical protein TcCL_NonESM04957 [Trypanosoma cruzi]